MADRITIDISILQGIFGDLTKLQQQLGGVTGGMSAVDAATSKAFAGMRSSMGGSTNAVNALDNAVDNSMRNMVSDIMAPVAKTQELETKLRRLGDQVRTSKSVKEIVALKREITATQKELDGVNASGMETKVGGAFGRMRSMVSSFAAPLVGAFAVGGITAFAGDLVKATAAQQAYDASLKTMLVSKEKADILGGKVKEFAAKTPFELTQVQDASKQLLAYQFQSEEVIPAMRTLGNVAAALGQPFGEIAYLYGTAKSQGRLFTNDLNQFMGRGIPILKELSAVMGVSESKVRELTEKGKVGFPQLEAAMARLGGPAGKWANMLDEQSAAMGGQISNLADTWGQFKVELGTALAPLIMNVVGGLSSGIDYLRSTFGWVQANGDTIISVFQGIGVAVGIYTAALTINNAALIANNALQLVARVRMAAMAVITNVVTAATTVWTGIQWLLNSSLSVTAVVTGLVSAATQVWTGVQWLLNAALWANPIGVVIAAILALVAAVVYCWNEFAEFRAFIYSLWEAVKSTFGSIGDFIGRIFDSIVNIAVGAGRVLQGALTLDFDQVKSGMIQHAKGVQDLFSNILAAPDVATAAASKAAKAGMQGWKDGLASFEADKAAEAGVNKVGASAIKTPGVDANSFAAPGQNVGAASLLGGAPTKDTSPKADGVTLGGDGKAGGRTINVELTVNNHITMPKDANMGIRQVADGITAMIANKLNDYQYAAG